MPHILLGLLVLISSSAFAKPDSEECNKRHAEIDKHIKDSNHCKRDSDCKRLVLGGPYAEFGCFHYIHKKVDVNSIMQRMYEYTRANCSRVINDCMGFGRPVCREGKCFVRPVRAGGKK